MGVNIRVIYGNGIKGSLLKSLEGKPRYLFYILVMIKGLGFGGLGLGGICFILYLWYSSYVRSNEASL